MLGWAGYETCRRRRRDSNGCRASGIEGRVRRGSVVGMSGGREKGTHTHPQTSAFGFCLCTPLEASRSLCPRAHRLFEIWEGRDGSQSDSVLRSPLSLVLPQILQLHHTLTPCTSYKYTLSVAHSRLPPPRLPPQTAMTYMSPPPTPPHNQTSFSASSSAGPSTPGAPAFRLPQQPTILLKAPSDDTVARLHQLAPYYWSHPQTTNCAIRECFDLAILSVPGHDNHERQNTEISSVHWLLSTLLATALFGMSLAESLPRRSRTAVRSRASSCVDGHRRAVLCVHPEDGPSWAAGTSSSTILVRGLLPHPDPVFATQASLVPFDP